MNCDLKNLINDAAGYMLLEVMVSVLLVSTALIFLTARISQSIQGSNLSEEKAVATRLAQGGAEWLKGWRDDVGWAYFRDNGNFMADQPIVGMCWPNEPMDESAFSGYKQANPTDNCPAGAIENLYSRKILLERIDPSTIKFTVTVLWTSGRKERNVSISGEIKERQT